MPQLEIGPRRYRWLTASRRLRLFQRRWFRVLGIAVGLWCGVTIGVARYMIDHAPLWPTVFISCLPVVVWALALVWSDTAPQ